MNSLARPAAQYDATTILFHWLTAFVVVGQWVGAKTIDMWPRGTPRIDARSIHITFGILLGLLLIARIVWRSTRGRRLPRAEKGILGPLAELTHWALYALVASTIVLGVTLMILRGDSYFGMIRLPLWGSSAPQLRHTVQNLHDLFATTLLVLAGVHAAAALLHRYVLGDDVLARMLPRGS